MADFFPGGVIRFVPPPFDEIYWAKFGIPARCQPAAWGNSYHLRHGAQYAVTGAPVASGTAGVSRKISTGRKARGYASGDSGIPRP